MQLLTELSTYQWSHCLEGQRINEDHFYSFKYKYLGVTDMSLSSEDRGWKGRAQVIIIISEQEKRRGYCISEKDTRENP
jgi:hypothetical protein